MTKLMKHRQSNFADNILNFKNSKNAWIKQGFLCENKFWFHNITSIRFIKFSCRNRFNIRISRRAIFFTLGSSSVSRNFFIATIWNITANHFHWISNSFVTHANFLIPLSMRPDVLNISYSDYFICQNSQFKLYSRSKTFGCIDIEIKKSEFWQKLNFFGVWLWSKTKPHKVNEVGVLKK